ncbi:ASCH domain-containing protein [Clostridium sp. HBUAS56010]|uniref:ASCH domain-containing protein n=1 Tax=Clostridium sp. HBUAS56010 TaxID=2571127 RepID=UPI001FAA32B7|nr:ASCH domain-containing protein [Clostridium sp. HBUAS56010]
MSVKPILFNTDMVRAILDGRKTVTRRKIDVDISNQFDIEVDGTVICYIDQATGDSHNHINLCRYHPGDILYVRETWHEYVKRVGKGGDCYLAEFYGYKASVKNSEDANTPWKPSIHMPKEAARIWIKVTDVRVEKLQDITEEQAIKEGCCTFQDKTGNGKFNDIIEFDLTARDAFAELWNSTLKKDSNCTWAHNPWVWVIEFERCEKPGQWEE